MKLDGEIAPLYSDKGQPGIETLFVIVRLLLKHIYGLSDDGVCERWVDDPYFQHFTGEQIVASKSLPLFSRAAPYVTTHRATSAPQYTRQA